MSKRRGSTKYIGVLEYFPVDTTATKTIRARELASRGEMIGEPPFTCHCCGKPLRFLPAIIMAVCAECDEIDQLVIDGGGTFISVEYHWHYEYLPTLLARQQARLGTQCEKHAAK